MEEKNFNIMRDLQGYFKDGERTRIYNSAESLRDKVLIRLLWITGRRLGEILDVKVHEIDFEINKISFHIEKKTEMINKIRVKKDLVKLKPIDKFTIKLLKDYIEEYSLNKSDYLFKSDFKEGSHISRQRAFQIVRRACKNAGINKVGKGMPHPHHFRHTFAIDMAKKLKTPSDIRKLQMMLEHSNLAVTEQYLQFSDEDLKDMVNNIGN